MADGSTTGGWESARIGDLADAQGWSAIRRRFGIEAFGVNAWTATADARVVPEHDEVPSGHEELYVVVAGHATFAVDGAEVDAPTGTIVVVRDPVVKRGAVSREPGTTVLVVGGEPGTAYRPRAWETNAEVYALLDGGQYAEARRLLQEALEVYDDRGALLFNLACAESLLGETDDALEHLREALKERPELSANAREDGDLASIRDDPRFAAILDAD